MEENRIIKFEDIIKIIKRRKWAFILPALAVVFLTVIVLLVWKPVFRSTSTILIEEQEIPREYVMATVTSFAEQRLQTINQRIMSSTKLLEIIHTFNLYADRFEKVTTEEIIDDMRKKDIKFGTVTADVIDRQTGRPASATIAFTVSYEGKNPVLVQQVANALSSLYLEENMKVVGQQTAGAAKFLEDEAKTVQSELAELDRQIMIYKEKNPRSLPELYQFNLQALDSSDRSRDDLNAQLRSLRERESYMQTELATVKPETENQDKERLKELRSALLSLTTRYSDEYPDVIKTKTEISELEKKMQSDGSQPNASETADNPSYIALSSQLAGVQSEIKSVKRQLEDLDEKRADYRRRLEQSPRVEESYKNMLSERNNTQLKYDDLMKKFMEAKVAQGLEKDKMGEHFTLIDPARLPEKPVRPNRLAVILIGLIMAIGAGIGTVALQETADQSARRAEDLVSVFPFPVLAEIPEIITLGDKKNKMNRLRIVAGTAVFVLVSFVVFVHLFVMDLDVLWARVARQFF